MHNLDLGHNRRSLDLCSLIGLNFRGCLVDLKGKIQHTHILFHSLNINNNQEHTGVALGLGLEEDSGLGAMKLLVYVVVSPFSVRKGSGDGGLLFRDTPTDAFRDTPTDRGLEALGRRFVVV